MGTTRSREHFERALKNQLAALRASCAGYDKGDEWEAARLATVVHTIVHDAGKRNRSLLTQMEKKETLLFLASGERINPRNLLASTPLVFMRLNGEGAKYLPHLNDGPPISPSWLRFNEWWERDVIYQSGPSHSEPLTLTRRRLVFALRNKEGGAHFDTFLDDPGYIATSQKPIWHSIIGSIAEPLRGLELASMRQVAWELLETLKDADSSN